MRGNQVAGTDVIHGLHVHVRVFICWFW